MRALSGTCARAREEEGSATAWRWQRRLWRRRRRRRRDQHNTTPHLHADVALLLAAQQAAAQEEPAAGEEGGHGADGDQEVEDHVVASLSPSWALLAVSHFKEALIAPARACALLCSPDTLAREGEAIVIVTPSRQLYRSGLRGGCWVRAEARRDGERCCAQQQWSLAAAARVVR